MARAARRGGRKVTPRASMACSAHSGKRPVRTRNDDDTRSLTNGVLRRPLSPAVAPAVLLLADISIAGSGNASACESPSTPTASTIAWPALVLAYACRLGAALFVDELALRFTSATSRFDMPLSTSSRTFWRSDVVDVALPRLAAASCAMASCTITLASSAPCDTLFCVSCDGSAAIASKAIDRLRRRSTSSRKRCLFGFTSLLCVQCAKQSETIS